MQNDFTGLGSIVYGYNGMPNWSPLMGTLDDEESTPTEDHGPHTV